LGADLLIGISAGDQAKDLYFALGQTIIRRMLCQFSRDIRRDALLAGMNQPNRVEELFA